MHADTGRLVCAGDDGTVRAYDFAGGGGGPSGGTQGAVARREARLGPMTGGFGPSANARASASASDKPRSSAEAYADKKRAAMERAEQIKAERRAKEEAARGGGGGGGGGRPGGRPPPMERPPWDDAMPEVVAVPRNEFGTPLGPPGGRPGGGAQQAAQDELDALHALGDKKFGKRR